MESVTEQMKEYVWSASKKNRYTQCGFHWKMIFEDQITSKTDRRYADVGTIVHETIKTFLRMQEAKTASHPETKDLLESIMKDLWDNSLNTLKPRANKCLDNFSNFFIDLRNKCPDLLRGAIIEKKISTTINPIDPIKIRGIIDFYSPVLGLLIDWKTGAAITLYPPMAFQGKMYEILIRSLNYEMPKTMFLMLQNNLQIDLPAMTDSWLIQELISCRDGVLAGQFPKRRGALCAWCPFQIRCVTDGICLWNL